MIDISIMKRYQPQYKGGPQIKIDSPGSRRKRGLRRTDKTQRSGPVKIIVCNGELVDTSLPKKHSEPFDTTTPKKRSTLSLPAQELKEAFAALSKTTAISLDEFAHEYKTGGVQRIRELVAWSLVPPWG